MPRGRPERLYQPVAVIPLQLRRLRCDFVIHQPSPLVAVPIHAVDAVQRLRYGRRLADARADF